MRLLGLILCCIWSVTVFAEESIHKDSPKIPKLSYYEKPQSTDTLRKKARRRRLKDKISKAEDIILSEEGDKSSLLIASPIIEKGARVEELNITLTTRDITFIVK